MYNVAFVIIMIMVAAVVVVRVVTVGLWHQLWWWNAGNELI